MTGEVSDGVERAGSGPALRRAAVRTDARSGASSRSKPGRRPGGRDGDAESRSRPVQAPPPVHDGFVSATESALDLLIPAAVRALYDDPPSGSETLLYRPDLASEDPMSVPAALAALNTSAHPAPPNLLPLSPVDERSMAVVVCQASGHDTLPGVGTVVRWHLDDVPDEYQAEVLDIDAASCLTSAIQETAARAEGRKRVDIEADAYRRIYVETGTRPKTHVLRPVQLACQNVIVGLAAFRHDSSFDGLAVPMWQTCEVPHVAAHEGVRGLTVLMLCDAYQCGGTMEIRFRSHPERAVPAALRRYARVRGITLGAGREAAITPAQARVLFLTVTPMSPSLRERAEAAFAVGAITPERLCYTLLAGLWRDVEVEFMLACSPRAASVLAGGADPEDRRARAAESELARAALLVGTLHRRLDSVDTAGDAGEVRVFEDTRRGVQATVLADRGAVLFRGATGALPWLPVGAAPVIVPDAGLLAVPRAHPTNEDVALAQDLQQRGDALVALVVPHDRDGFVDCDVPVLRCPDSVNELDMAIEPKLMTARVSRA